MSDTLVVVEKPRAPKKSLYSIFVQVERGKDEVDYILKHELRSFNEAVTNFKRDQGVQY